MALKICLCFLILSTVSSANLNMSTETHNFSSVVPRMEWMTQLFDHNAWQVGYQLQNSSHVCQEHIAEYLQELKREISWATKMNDASGRYNGQFFFGNDFWLGSSTLCWELGNRDTNTVVPPFSVHFNVAKVHININDSNTSSGTRELFIGFCLPSSCTPDDLTSLLKYDAMRATSVTKNTTIEIMIVRPVPGDYNLLKDIKFYIVGGTAVAIATIVIIATFYETWLISKVRKTIDEEAQHPTNNNNESKNNSEMTQNEIRNKIKPKQNAAKGIPSRLLLCFSAVSNGKKILEVENLPKDSIKCVHGLRFLSVVWVILVHTYLEVFSVAENKTLRIITERYFIYQTVSNATFSVDSFFFISGLLVTILYFRTSKQKQQTTQLQHAGNNENRNHMFSTVSANVKSFFLLIFYRVMRLTPAYLFVLGVHEVTLRYIHNTSVFEPNFYDHITCDKYWWRNALYINTWYPQREICMLWSWYMSNDTQFYIIAVAILLIAVRSDKHLKVAAGIVLGFLLTSTVTTFVIAYQYNYHAKIEEPFALFDQLYDKPWMRIGPYLVGMVTGWFLYKVECRLTMSRWTVTIGWLASITCLLSLVYGLGKHGLTLPLSAIYAALGHTAWGLALGWITLACCTGYGGLVNHLLSFRGFLPFSRLTYCAYLIHPMIMCITSFQMDGPMHLHNGLVFVMFFGNAVVAFILSFLVSIGFEAPVVRLLKIIMGGRSKDD